LLIKKINFFFRRLGWLISLCALFLFAWTQAVHATPVFDKITILVPAGRSGGWDLTAKAMAEAIQANGEALSVEIEYSPGAGGLIGMAQFLSSGQGMETALMVGGSFTVGAAVQNHAAITLLDTRPLARLTFDTAVVAVPASSQIKTAEDLIEAMLSAPESISWVGGSIAGVDEINVHEIANKLGIASHRLHYTGLPGGGEAGQALAGGRYQAGISGFSEFEYLVREGKLRIIAAARKDVLSDIGVRSFDELGIRIERFNWRGVFAHPNSSDEQFAAMSGLIERMVKSEQWQQLLRQHHWQDAYLPGTEFIEFVKAEQIQIGADLASMKLADGSDEKTVGNVLARRYVWAWALAGLSALLIIFVVIQRQRAHHREVGLQHAFEAATGQANLVTEELERAMAGIHAQIEQEFDNWNLTIAEREIALLLLKGLRLKEIADARGTSERTVRQQAQAVYKKAGLEGRSELAAFFIEDFMLSMELSS
jgi:putative tricarboxylic transport membrane protein